jgi:hypothetical protein
MHIHDLQPFKQMKFDLSHTIRKLSFGVDYPGIVNPLDGLTKNAEKDAMGMYQYFVKVVPTIYEDIQGKILNTNQFSVTEHYKPIPPDGNHGLPGKIILSFLLVLLTLSLFFFSSQGVFVMYELSPIMVKFTESRKSFAHFLTGVCAIIGGVYTVAGILDSFIYHSMKSLKKKVELGKAS